MIVIFVAFLALVSGGSLLMKDREFHQMKTDIWQNRPD
jgi:hypothetical protein